MEFSVLLNIERLSAIRNNFMVSIILITGICALWKIHLDFSLTLAQQQASLKSMCIVYFLWRIHGRNMANNTFRALGILFSRMHSENGILEFIYYAHLQRSFSLSNVHWIFGCFWQRLLCAEKMSILLFWVLSDS